MGFGGDGCPDGVTHGWLTVGGWWLVGGVEPVGGVLVGVEVVEEANWGVV